MRYLPALVLLAACGGTADVTGTYTVNLTNHANGCAFQNWTVGDVATGIPVTISQDGDSASADVGGGAGGFLQLWLGGKVFNGSVDGSDFTATITGTNPNSSGNCAYTFNATLDATLDGDTLSGVVDYAAQTNNGTDCGALTGCVSEQAMNGTRPPQ